MNNEVIFDNNKGFHLTEDEYGNLWSNIYGEVHEEFHNFGDNNLINVYEEVY